MAAQEAGAADAADSGLYFLKHRAKLHRVRSYGHTACGLTVPQQQSNCDAVFECVGFTRADSGCGHQILEEYDVRKCKARCHLPIHTHVSIVGSPTRFYFSILRLDGDERLRVVVRRSGGEASGDLDFLELNRRSLI
jgi:hypothetical protein